MFEGTKETQCTRCLHKDVCIYKQDFLDICNAVFGAEVHKSCDDVKKVMMKKIVNFECLGDIQITCRFYIQNKPAFREDGINLGNT